MEPMGSPAFEFLAPQPRPCGTPVWVGPLLDGANAEALTDVPIGSYVVPLCGLYWNPIR